MPKKTTNPLVTDKEDYKLTKLGRAIVEVAKDQTDEENWWNFYNAFLNSKFYLPVKAKKLDATGKITDQTDFNVIQSVDEDGVKSLILFEKSSRCRDWNKYKSNLSEKDKKDLYAFEYAKGFHFIDANTPSFFKKQRLKIDFGKDTVFIMEPEMVLWLKKFAKPVEKSKNS